MYPFLNMLLILSVFSSLVTGSWILDSRKKGTRFAPKSNTVKGAKSSALSVLAMMLYVRYSKAQRYQHVCNMEDNYFGTMARNVVRMHPNYEQLSKLIRFSGDDVKRNLYVTKNFKNTGIYAILATPPNAPAPTIDATPLAEQDFLEEMHGVFTEYDIHDTIVDNMYLYPEPYYFGRTQGKAYTLPFTHTRK